MCFHKGYEVLVGFVETHEQAFFCCPVAQDIRPADLVAYFFGLFPARLMPVIGNGYAVINRPGPFGPGKAGLVRAYAYFDGYPARLWGAQRIGQQRHFARGELRLQEVLQGLPYVSPLAFYFGAGRYGTAVEYHHVHRLLSEKTGIRRGIHFLRTADINLLGIRMISCQSGKGDKQDKTFHAAKLANGCHYGNKNRKDRGATPAALPGILAPVWG